MPATVHTFTVNNTSFQGWAAAKAAAITLAQQRNAAVDVLRDDGGVWTITPRKVPTQRPVASTQAAAPAQADVIAQLLAAVTKLNATIDAQNTRLEALETKHAARRTKA